MNSNHSFRDATVWGFSDTSSHNSPSQNNLFGKIEQPPPTTPTLSEAGTFPRRSSRISFSGESLKSGKSSKYGTPPRGFVNGGQFGHIREELIQFGMASEHGSANNLDNSYGHPSLQPMSQKPSPLHIEQNYQKHNSSAPLSSKNSKKMDVGAPILISSSANVRIVPRSQVMKNGVSYSQPVHEQSFPPPTQYSIAPPPPSHDQQSSRLSYAHTSPKNGPTSQPQLSPQHQPTKSFSSNYPSSVSNANYFPTYPQQLQEFQDVDSVWKHAAKEASIQISTETKKKKRSDSFGRSKVEEPKPGPGALDHIFNLDAAKSTHSPIFQNSNEGYMKPQFMSNAIQNPPQFLSTAIPNPYHATSSARSPPPPSMSPQYDESERLNELLKVRQMEQQEQRILMKNNLNTVPKPPPAEPLPPIPNDISNQINANLTNGRSNTIINKPIEIPPPSNTIANDSNAFFGTIPPPPNPPPSNPLPPVPFQRSQMNYMNHNDFEVMNAYPEDIPPNNHPPLLDDDEIPPNNHPPLPPELIHPQLTLTNLYTKMNDGKLVFKETTEMQGDTMDRPKHERRSSYTFSIASRPSKESLSAGIEPLPPVPTYEEIESYRNMQPVMIAGELVTPVKKIMMEQEQKRIEIQLEQAFGGIFNSKDELVPPQPVHDYFPKVETSGPSSGKRVQRKKSIVDRFGGILRRTFTTSKDKDKEKDKREEVMSRTPSPMGDEYGIFRSNSHVNASGRSRSNLEVPLSHSPVPSHAFSTQPSPTFDNITVPVPPSPATSAFRQKNPNHGSIPQFHATDNFQPENPTNTPYSADFHPVPVVSRDPGFTSPSFAEDTSLTDALEVASRLIDKSDTFKLVKSETGDINVLFSPNRKDNSSVNNINNNESPYKLNLEERRSTPKIDLERSKSQTPSVMNYPSMNTSASVKEYPTNSSATTFPTLDKSSLHSVSEEYLGFTNSSDLQNLEDWSRRMGMVGLQPAISEIRLSMDFKSTESSPVLFPATTLSTATTMAEQTKPKTAEEKRVSANVLNGWNSDKYYHVLDEDLESLNEVFDDKNPSFASIAEFETSSIGNFDDIADTFRAINIGGKVNVVGRNSFIGIGEKEFGKSPAASAKSGGSSIRIYEDSTDYDD
ncbi:hypothetical protein HK098_000441 [Nowakowskiella sp. JEL0407]|nr:hypothetical protein HK098_000441 [Nowakowskiella sp. JEL0407]